MPRTQPEPSHRPPLPQAQSDLSVVPLAADQLYRAARLDRLLFETIADIALVPGMISQPRAFAAIEFGADMMQSGFNIFAIGASGARVQFLVRTMMKESVRRRPLPSDWAYVNNFAKPHRPVAIAMPGRRAPILQHAIHDLIEDLSAALPAVFESETYQKRRASIVEAIQEENTRAFAELNEKATARNIAILRTPMGFGMAPMRDRKLVSPTDFHTSSDQGQLAVRAAIEELEQTLRAMPPPSHSQPVDAHAL